MDHFVDTFHYDKHIDLENRLRMKEEAMLRLLCDNKEGKTRSKVKDEMRQSTVDYNLKNFAHVPKGVHGQELPKFSESPETAFYWTKDPKYNPNPNYSSFK